MKLNELKIATRLWGVLGLLIARLLAIVTVALLQMQTTRDGTLDITDNWLPNVEVVTAMKTGISNLRTYETQHVLNTDETATANIEMALAQTLADTAAAEPVRVPHDPPHSLAAPRRPTTRTAAHAGRRRSRLAA